MTPTEDEEHHAAARAACEAGYLDLPEYLDLCERHGWVPS
jgi:hypothetical protein